MTVFIIIIQQGRGTKHLLITAVYQLLHIYMESLFYLWIRIHVSINYTNHSCLITYVMERECIKTDNPYPPPVQIMNPAMMI